MEGGYQTPLLRRKRHSLRREPCGFLPSSALLLLRSPCGKAARGPLISPTPPVTPGSKGAAAPLRYPLHLVDAGSSSTGFVLISSGGAEQDLSKYGFPRCAAGGAQGGAAVSGRGIVPAPGGARLVKSLPRCTAGGFTRWGGSPTCVGGYGECRGEVRKNRVPKIFDFGKEEQSQSGREIEAKRKF